MLGVCLKLMIKVSYYVFILLEGINYEHYSISNKCFFPYELAEKGELFFFPCVMRNRKDC